jgi:hypothetical protein
MDARRENILHFFLTLYFLIEIFRFQFSPGKRKCSYIHVYILDITITSEENKHRYKDLQHPYCHIGPQKLPILRIKILLGHIPESGPSTHPGIKIQTKNEEEEATVAAKSILSPSCGPVHIILLRFSVAHA